MNGNYFLIVLAFVVGVTHAKPDTRGGLLKLQSFNGEFDNKTSVLKSVSYFSENNNCILINDVKSISKETNVIENTNKMTIDFSNFPIERILIYETTASKIWVNAEYQLYIKLLDSVVKQEVRSDIYNGFNYNKSPNYIMLFFKNKSSAEEAKQLITNIVDECMP